MHTSESLRGPRLPMLTPVFLELWMRAKSCSWRLRHPAVTATHLLYVFLRGDERRVHRAWKDCPVRAVDVRAFMKEDPSPEPAGATIHEISVAPSAQVILDRATELGGSVVGEKALVKALKQETVALLASILAHRSAPRTPPLTTPPQS